VDHLTLAVRYHADQFRRQFPDCGFVCEDEPLGTGGALNRIDFPREPLLVLNADLWTDLDFRALAAFHRHHGAALTAASWSYESHNPYGLLLTDGLKVTGLREKAGVWSPVLAGVYLLSPVCGDFLPKGRFDMPDLIAALLAYELPVKHFPIRGTWHDIGTPEDYARVCALAEREGVTV
jgi:NDP-sugar pyrophosphorylase family protein